jgi:hypothetical protein
MKSARGWKTFCTPFGPLDLADPTPPVQCPSFFWLRHPAPVVHIRGRDSGLPPLLARSDEAGPARCPAALTRSRTAMTCRHRSRHRPPRARPAPRRQLPCSGPCGRLTRPSARQTCAVRECQPSPSALTPCNSALPAALPLSPPLRALLDRTPPRRTCAQ